MAEGFARAYGSDVLEPASAGLCSRLYSSAAHKKVMSAKNINIEAQYPKNLNAVDVAASTS